MQTCHILQIESNEKSDRSRTFCQADIFEMNQIVDALL